MKKIKIDIILSTVIGLWLSFSQNIMLSLVVVILFIGTYYDKRIMFITHLTNLITAKMLNMDLFVFMYLSTCLTFYITKNYYDNKYLKIHKNFIEEHKLNQAINYMSSILASSNNPDINSLLKSICQVSGFDKISLYKVENKKVLIENSYNVISSRKNIHGIILDDNVMKFMEDKPEVYIYDSEGDSVISNYFKKHSQNFFVYIPIYTKDHFLYGFFFCENVTNKQRWTYENYKILKNISYSFSSYIGRKLAEEMLSNSAKMSALGEISAGIAHEINNPLAIMHGQSSIIQLVLNEAKDNKTIPEDILNELIEHNDLLLSTLIRTDKIINGLRYFIRNDDLNPFEKADVNSILDTVQILAINQCLKKGIHVEIKKENINDETLIECNPTQIAQVLINLITNSMDAIENLQEKWIEIKIKRIGNNIKISVIDSGSGISPELGEKILQKFYTTKKHNSKSGSGLGLNIVKRIIELHGGTLSIDYHYKNTKFDILLPMEIGEKDKFLEIA